MIKKLLIILVFIPISCTPSLLRNGLRNGDPITIRVENHGDTFTGRSQFYVSEIRKNGETFEMEVTKAETKVTYLLPPNKILLLSEIEVFLNDLNDVHLSYYLVIIQSNKKKNSYRINTDIVNDFITGLKK